jgi:hypothetical protein
MIRTLAFCAVVLALPAAAQDETIPNPLYTNWAKFKPGTEVVLKSTSVTKVAGQETKSESTIAYALKELTDEKAVVEMVSASNVNGTDIKTPPFAMTFTKTIKKAPAAPPAGTAAQAKPEEGTETLKIAGGEYKAKWTKVKTSVAGTESVTTTWYSDDVPGTTLKNESVITGPVSTTVSMELVSIKKP